MTQENYFRLGQKNFGESKWQPVYGSYASFLDDKHLLDLNFQLAGPLRSLVNLTEEEKIELASYLKYSTNQKEHPNIKREEELLSKCPFSTFLPPIDIDVNDELGGFNLDDSRKIGLEYAIKIDSEMKKRGLGSPRWFKSNDRGGYHGDLLAGINSDSTILLKSYGYLLRKIAKDCDIPCLSDLPREKKNRNIYVYLDDTLFNRSASKRGVQWRLPGSCKPGGFKKTPADIRNDGNKISIITNIKYLEEVKNICIEKEKKEKENLGRKIKDFGLYNYNLSKPNQDDLDFIYLDNELQHIWNQDKEDIDDRSIREWKFARIALSLGADANKTARLLMSMPYSKCGIRKERYTFQLIDSVIRIGLLKQNKYSYENQDIDDDFSSPTTSKAEEEYNKKSEIAEEAKKHNIRVNYIKDKIKNNNGKLVVINGIKYLSFNEGGPFLVDWEDGDPELEAMAHGTNTSPTTSNQEKETATKISQDEEAGEKHDPACKEAVCGNALDRHSRIKKPRQQYPFDPDEPEEKTSKTEKIPTHLSTEDGLCLRVVGFRLEPGKSSPFIAIDLEGGRSGILDGGEFKEGNIFNKEFHDRLCEHNELYHKCLKCERNYKRLNKKEEKEEDKHKYVKQHWKELENRDKEKQRKIRDGIDWKQELEDPLGVLSKRSYSSQERKILLSAVEVSDKLFYRKSKKTHAYPHKGIKIPLEKRAPSIAGSLEAAAYCGRLSRKTYCNDCRSVSFETSIVCARWVCSLCALKRIDSFISLTNISWGTKKIICFRISDSEKTVKSSNAIAKDVLEKVKEIGYRREAFSYVRGVGEFAGFIYEKDEDMHDAIKKMLHKKLGCHANVERGLDITRKYIRPILESRVRLVISCILNKNIEELASNPWFGRVKSHFSGREKSGSEISFPTEKEMREHLKNKITNGRCLDPTTCKKCKKQAKLYYCDNFKKKCLIKTNNIMDAGSVIALLISGREEYLSSEEKNNLFEGYEEEPAVLEEEFQQSNL